MTPSRMALALRMRRARPHAGLAVLLVLASALRWAIDRNAVPSVYQDSLVYLRAAPHAPFAPYSPTRPSGYPLLLRILDVLPGRQLEVAALTQHLAGLAVGALVYFLVLRAGGRRWLALVAAAVVLSDSYTVALEQAILAETFFTLALTASAYFTVRGSDLPLLGALKAVEGRSARQERERRRFRWSLVAGGLLLGVACTIRSVGIFAVPVWALWVILSRIDRRAVVAGLAAVAFPVVGFCAVHAAGGAGFSLQGSDGWFLFAKIGPIADCAGASVPPEAVPLCMEPRPDKPFEFFLYEAGSPAYQVFHGGTAVYLEDAITPENNRILRRFSVAMIEAHPTDFVRLVGRELLRYLAPSTAQSELTLYSRPGTLLRMYERTFHVRWWLYTGALVAGLAWVLFGRRARTLGLLVGLSLALVLGAAATSGFNSRYLVPTFPLVAAAGVLALDEAMRWLDRESELELRRRRDEELDPDPAGA